MPRLQTSLLLNAYKLDAHLPLLLRSCRNVDSALNELRWLREHALNIVHKRPNIRKGLGWRTLLLKLCKKRATGYPLQYLLGSEYFGELEIQCRPGVLIPRQVRPTCEREIIFFWFAYMAVQTRDCCMGIFTC